MEDPEPVLTLRLRRFADLGAAEHSDLLGLLDRSTQFDNHPAFPDPEVGVEDERRVLLGYSAGDDDADSNLVGAALISPTQGGWTSVHAVVDPAHRNGTVRTQLLKAALDEVDGPVRLWAMRATDQDDADAASLGFTPERDLLQIRVPLPLPPDVTAAARPVITRPFVLGQDDEEWLRINNLAFEGHPEQGGWTLDQFHTRLRAEWVDLDGFLMGEAPDGSGLVGSCWTKIHRHLPQSPHELGEIYVIAVDPARHGQGWGRALTVAGLEWLAAQGLTTGMLYTTGSNTAAVSLYRALGFEVEHTDRSYVPVPVPMPLPTP